MQNYCVKEIERVGGNGQKKGNFKNQNDNFRELYLVTHSQIDSFGHLVKKFRLKYRSWKYW